MQSIQRVFFLAVFASAIFASASTAQTTLRYQFKEGEEFGFVIERKLQTATHFMGKDNDTKMTMFLDLSWKVLKVDDKGQAQVRIKVGHAKVIMDGAKGKVEADSKNTAGSEDDIGKVLGHLAKAMGAMELTGSVLPTGEMKDMKVTDEAAKALKQSPDAEKLGMALTADAFKNLIAILVLPKDEVSKGKTWSNKTESKFPTLGKMIVDYACTYEGQIDKDGAKLDKISVTPAVKFEAETNAQGKLEITNVKGGGEILFDAKKGRLVESMLQTRVDVVLIANGENIRQVIDETATIRAKK